MHIIKKEQVIDLLLKQPEKFYAELPVKTLSDIQQSSTPSLAVLRKDLGKTVCKAVVIIALDDLIEFYNVKMSFTDAQVNQTADLIMDTFFWFKMDDFKLCFNRAKTGYYGAAYNRLDGSVIFEWLNRYAEERAQHFATSTEYNKLEQPAIRNASGATDIHKLYDKVVIEQMKANQERDRKKQQEEEGRKKAIEQWHEDYRNHFEGVEVTEHLHNEYVSKYPLSESYIRYFIQKMQNDGNDIE